MSKKSIPQESPVILANRDGVADSIGEWISARLNGRGCGIVCVSENGVPAKQVFNLKGNTEISRLLIIFEGLPIDPLIVQLWRDWARERRAADVRMAIARNQIDQEGLESILMHHCSDWEKDIPEEETIALTKGNFVKMSDAPTPKDDSSHLTMMFGSMGELLTGLEIAAHRFGSACNEAKFNSDKCEKLKDEVRKRLEAEKPSRELQKAPPTGLENQIDHFPKVLLYGESGVGKTLIASYLQSRTGLVEGRPLRIPIPEYLGKEDSFEYDLFGYAKGAYTGGKEKGSLGKLLGHLGGVIFLDEIGEANAEIQAKLLAFLDDYRVCPRGWEGEYFHCPVLIVAATNQDLSKMVKKGTFRGDLLNRFTDRHTIPPLRKRMEDIEFILDCLLQRKSLNPDWYICNIGSGALDAIKKRSFQEGNFRELEDWFRRACRNARREGRNYLVAEDVIS